MSTEVAVSSVDRIAVASDAADALEALYLAHRVAVFHYLRATSRDEDRALDLSATTFERAFRELRAGREPGIGWLLRTAPNAAIDADRRTRTAALFHRRSTPADATVPSSEDAAIGAEQGGWHARERRARPPAAAPTRCAGAPVHE